MKCGLYDESYKIAADTNLLVNYLYNCHLKVAYLPEFVTRMRMGGMSTDSAKRQKVWDEDIRVYSGYGFKPVTLTKLMKMAWKVPQFIQAKFMKQIRKPTRPSLPLRKAPPFSPSLSSIVFTTPSVPLLGDRNLRDERMQLALLQRRQGFGQPAEPVPARGWLGGLTQQSCECLSASTLSNLLIACSFSAFFLVVSIKKLIFAEKFNV